MARDLIIDEEDSGEAYVPRPRFRSNFGTIYTRKIKCSGAAGIACGRAGTLKGGKLWYCVYHAPRGSEG